MTAPPSEPPSLPRLMAASTSDGERRGERRQSGREVSNVQVHAVWCGCTCTQGHCPSAMYTHAHRAPPPNLEDST